MVDLIKISKLIYRTQIISFGHYILSSGLHSPYYLDFTMLSNKPSYLKTLIRESIAYLDKLDVLDDTDKIVGILDKGVVIAIPLALETGKPFALYSLTKGDFSVGGIDVNDRILLVDDMLSTGKTLCRVLDDIKEDYGVDVKNVFVVLDREEGGFERLTKREVKVHRLVKISELAKILKDYGIISDEEYDVIEAHLNEVRSKI